MRFVLPALLCVLSVGSVVRCDLDLTIIHNNDIHAHFDAVSARTSACRPPGPCYGGIGRLVSTVRRLRARAAHPLVLYGGDMFQGTLYYTLFKWRVVAELINLVPYDAMALGNHEFDDGLSGLTPYLERLRHPLLCTNVHFGRHASAATERCLSSVVRQFGDHRVGIVGYTTTTTPITSSPPEGVLFEDEVAALQREVRKLQNAGVQIIIATGHSGYVREKQMAEQIDGIDVIVGGHSHSLLYNGTAPDGDRVAGPYPTVVHQPSGRTVLVVQAYQYGKYLGVLNVTFDADGEVRGWSGNPIVVDGDEDEEAIRRLAGYTEQVREKERQVVGQTHVRLEGDRDVCRREECNMGNLIADAMVRAVLRPAPGQWSTVGAAVMHGGGIRAAIAPGNISLADVMEVLPFGNTVDVVTVSGDTLRHMFEHSVGGVDQLQGRFLQVSGIRVTYDLSRPVGGRVVHLEVVCTRCEVPRLEPVRPQQHYRIAIPTYLLKGGDGYSFIKEKKLDAANIGALDVDVLQAEVVRQSPIVTGLQERIVFVDSRDVEMLSRQQRQLQQESPTTTPSSAERITATLTLIKCALAMTRV